jgi:microcin C transport system substrate-binding protein
MNKPLKLFPWLALSLLLLTHCDRNEGFAAYDNSAERQLFYQRHNATSRAQCSEKIAQLKTEIASTTDAAALAEKNSMLSLAEKKLKDGDFFQWKKEDDLPTGLDWQSNDRDPDVGSPDAKKGGTYHTFFPGMAYPPTIRCLGQDGNNSFRSYHWDYIEMGLLSTHPNTGNLIPAIADRWAITADQQTVYFHLNPLARWSDGEKITTDDFFMAFYVYLSPYLT